MVKLCDTCVKVKIIGKNFYSNNNEKWITKPFHIPVLGRDIGDQTVSINLGRVHSNCLVYFYATKSSYNNTGIDYLKAYENSKNNGLVKLDKEGKGNIRLDCPQIYIDNKEQYLNHIHFLVSNKKMTKWLPNIKTQSIICKITSDLLENHIRKNDRLIINALPAEYFDKSSIPSSVNIYYKDAIKMSKQEIKSIIKKKINENPRMKNVLNKLKLEDFPIITYCYDSDCDASHQLVMELMKAGFTNIIEYPDGIVGWLNKGKQGQTKKSKNSNKTKKKTAKLEKNR
jgi:rhodanese-related sulfurtransferase